MLIDSAFPPSTKSCVYIYEFNKKTLYIVLNVEKLEIKMLFDVL